MRNRGSILTYTVVLALVGCLFLIYLLRSNDVPLTARAVLEPTEENATMNEALRLIRPPAVETVIPDNVTESAALDAIARARLDMEEMMSFGFSISWSNDTLLDAMRSQQGKNITELLEKSRSLDATQRVQAAQALYALQHAEGGRIGANYTYAYLKALEVGKRKLWAYNLQDALTLLGDDLAELGDDGINLTGAEYYHGEAQRSFKEERFEETAEYIEKSYEALEDAKVEAARLSAILKAYRRTFGDFLARNWRVLLLLAILLAAAGYIIYVEVLIMVVRDRVRQLRLEREVLASLAKKAQRDYYSEKRIPKSMYETKTEKFRERELEINKDLPVLQARLDRYMARRLFGLLGGEEKR